MAPEDVLIDFKVDYSELTNAQEQLAKTGKVDTTQFAALSKSLSTTAKDTKGLVAEFKKVATTATQMGKTVESAFGAGIQDALDEAGVSLEEFSDALTKANQPAKTLKAELRELKEALAVAKVEGKDVGIQFETMRARAGALADAIQDAGSEIKNAGSDTRNIDNVVGSISALAGGFAAVQGAAALFGDENEDLQKALLKVNGAMALASGIQQFYNATLKEGALTKLADSIQTGVQTATQRIYTLVTGQATAATVAFKVALAATGIGLFVVGILALVSALNDTEDSLEDVNRSLEQQQSLLESTNTLIDRQTSLRVARAKAAGAAESELAKIEANGAVARFNATVDLDRSLRKTLSGQKETSKAYAETQKQIEENIETQGKLNTEIELATINGSALVKKEAEERQKAIAENAKKQSAALKAAQAEAKAARLAQLNDELAELEKRLLFVEKNTQAEVDLKSQVIKQKARIELEAEKLTENQIRLIKARSYKERLDLQETFNKQLTTLELQGQIDTNAALLAGIGITNDKRIELQIANIQATSQLEINAAEGNAEKILLIEAKKYADIRALQNAEIKRTLDAELDSVVKTNDIVKAGLSKIAADQKESIAVRVAALKGIESQELTAIDKKIAANEKLKQSDEDYQANYKKLAEERAGIEADTAQKVGDVTTQANEKRKLELQQIGELTIDVLGKAADFLQSLSQLASDQETARINLQKEQLQALVDAGAITEKEAKRRAQQIEILERQARQKQAQREKQAAVFNAILAIPQAFLAGLKQAGPILGAIYAGIAAAQAAVIIARPVPKFFRGKKGPYAGPGEVADMGSEIVERDGRMFLYTKPTQTYLGAKDKVYTHAETKQILHSTDTREIRQGNSERFDYDKLAKAIPKSSFSVNIDKDFIEESVGKGLAKNRYFNNRYKFN